jgi:RNA polymerase sigma-70 factor (TIGR02960 family)
MRKTGMHTTLIAHRLDEEALARHRRELHIHCYRLLASYDEAEDAVQEALTKAWKVRDRFDPEAGTVRAWLYAIATNVCLDRMRQVKALERSFAEVSWLQPYSDRLLDEVAPREEEPDAVVVARETIEIAYLALIQLLPTRQRAVLVLRDVLEWSAADTAAALEMTVPAVTSALQRARATIADAPRRDQPVTDVSPDEQQLLERFIDAHERMDPDAALAVVREDIRITMPPNPMFFEGREHMRTLFGHAETMGQWKLVPFWCNRMPGAASYLRKPGDTIFRPMKFDLLRIEDDRIAETTTFGPELFATFGLPLTVEG